MTPLNPQLYEALKIRFGHVEISNDGASNRVAYYPDPKRPGRLRSRHIVNGEYYKVSCMFCSDTRNRCWINYGFGKYDPKTSSHNKYLWKCYNSDCEGSYFNREQLFDEIQPGTLRQFRRLQKRAVRPASEESTDISPKPLEVRVPSEGELWTAKPGHPGLQYLAERGFVPPQEVAERWGLCYTSEGRRASPAFGDGRITIPVFAPPLHAVDGRDDPELVGWQARSIWTDRNSGFHLPKYLTCKGMKKSKILYGLPQTVGTQGPVVVVEGVTDVWRLHTNAVAIFGKSLSHAQKTLLLRYFAGRPVVFFFDADAAPESRKAMIDLVAARRSSYDEATVACAQLPTERGDVADCSFDEAWSLVAQSLNMNCDEILQSISWPKK